jgi:hypothetical protein
MSGPLRLCSLALALAAAAATASVHGKSHGDGHDHEGGSGQRAHVHGLAHLDGALDGTLLTLQLQTPGWDLIGFERTPRDDDERAKVESTRQRLSDGAGLFAFEPAGACTPAGAAKLTLPAALTEAQTGAKGEHKHDHNAKHDHDHDHGHDHADGKSEPAMHGGDWMIVWEFRCTDPAALQAIRVDWFDAFPGTERVQVQWIGPAGQGGYELTGSSRRIPIASR